MGPKHLIAEAAKVTAASRRRFQDLVFGDPELFGAWCELDRRERNSTSQKRRPVSTRPEEFDRDMRDYRRDALCRELSHASGEARFALHLDILAWHTADERIAIRQRLLNLWRDRYAPTMSANAAALTVLRHLANRSRSNPVSTGDLDQDQIIDKIWCCGHKLALRTVRASLI